MHVVGQANLRPPPEVGRAARWGGLAALGLFAVLLSEGRPGGLLRRGPFTSDFFDAQAEALLQGRLAVDPSVPGIEGFVHDGATHLYFGLAPAILRLPVALVTDSLAGRLTQLSMLAALAVTLWASHRLLWAARVRARGDGPPGPREPWVVAAFVAAVGCSSPLLFLSARPLVYHEVELWGVATTLLAVLALVHWWATPTDRALLAVAATVTLAMHTRASVGGGALAALVLCGGLAILWKRIDPRQLLLVALAAAVPVASYAAVNLARFDHPFSVPFEEQVLSSFDPDRQATLEATDGSLFGLEFAPTAIVTYARPDGIRLQPLFPWITFREHTPVIGDAVFDTVDRSASLPTVAPALVLLAAVGLASLVRQRARDPWLALAMGTAAGLLPTITIAFIANRYLADLTPPLVMLAAVGAWPVATWVARRPLLPRRAAASALVALAAIGTLVGATLALQSQRLLILPERQDRLAMVAFQYDLHDRLTGGPPPHVRQVDSVRGLDGRRGDVALEGPCRALYWNDGERWWPLELTAPRQLDLTGEVVEGRTTLVSTDRWAVVADVEGSSARVSYLLDGEPVRTGPEIDAALLGDGLAVRIDTVNAEVLVEAGTDLVLVAWFVDVSGDPAPGPGWTSDAADTPICDRLAERLRR